MEIEIFENEKEFINATIAFISQICGGKGISSVALSGGSTPQPIYKTLSKSKIDFSKVELFQVDERYIDQNNKDSNYKMIWKSLIKPINNKLKAFHFFDTSLEINECLKKYDTELKNIKQFDLTILGIGNDGHTASLFPNSTALTTKKTTAHTQTNTFAVKDRLTITFPVILNSKNILILIKGEDKKETLNKLLFENLDYKTFPAKKLLTSPNLYIHFCK